MVVSSSLLWRVEDESVAALARLPMFMLVGAGGLVCLAWATGCEGGFCRWCAMKVCLGWKCCRVRKPPAGCRRRRDLCGHEAAKRSAAKPPRSSAGRETHGVFVIPGHHSSICLSRCSSLKTCRLSPRKLVFRVSYMYRYLLRACEARRPKLGLSALVVGYIQKRMSGSETMDDCELGHSEIL